VIEALSRHLRGGTEANCDIRQQGQPAFRPRIEPGNLPRRIQVWCDDAMPVTSVCLCSRNGFFFSDFELVIAMKIYTTRDSAFKGDIATRLRAR
jgi:hypothetical protein